MTPPIVLPDHFLLSPKSFATIKPLVLNIFPSFPVAFDDIISLPIVWILYPLSLSIVQHRCVLQLPHIGRSHVHIVHNLCKMNLPFVFEEVV